MVSMDKRIGRAEGAPRGTDNRIDMYSVFAVKDGGKVLTVEYAGYRIGDVTWGLPLGGPGWTPPTRFEWDAARFATVEIFPVYVSR